MCTSKIYIICQSFFCKHNCFYPQVQLFFESIKDQANQLSATQLALDNLEKNIRWCERNLETLRAWLDEQRN